MGSLNKPHSVIVKMPQESFNKVSSGNVVGIENDNEITGRDFHRVIKVAGLGVQVGRPVDVFRPRFFGQRAYF